MSKKKNKTPYRVGKSRAGLGLFATEPFTRGDFVIEYKGPMLTNDEADEKGGRYLFTVGRNQIIDGTTRKNTARYLNHSCKPNCRTEIEDDHVYIYARRKIVPDEELTYNYGKEYFNDFLGKNCVCDFCRAKRKRS